MAVANDPGRCVTKFEPDTTLIAVIEMSQSGWLVAAIVPGLQRQPLKKLAVDEVGLLRQLEHWRDEATRAGHTVERIAVAFEAGRDGFWPPAGCALVASRHMSSTRPAWLSRASTGGPKRTGSILSCSSALSWAGCAANGATAAWRRSRPSRTTTPGVPPVSGRAWWPSAHAWWTACAPA